jgi:hypothetical protein
MATVTAEHVMKILELTDTLTLNREAIVIPLATEDNGDVVVLPGKRLRITVPRNQPFDGWLVELRSKLVKMDLSTFRP